MLKLVIVLGFFCLIAATIKPAPSVEELTKINNIYCKDICK